MPPSCSAWKGPGVDPCRRLGICTRPCMEPEGIEPSSRISQLPTSTRVVAGSISVPAGSSDERRRHLDRRVSRSSRGLSALWNQPDISDHAPSGVRRDPPRRSGRESVAMVASSKLCILFTWQGCSTARNEQPSLSGRNQVGPSCQRALSVYGRLLSGDAGEGQAHQATVSVWPGQALRTRRCTRS